MSAKLSSITDFEGFVADWRGILRASFNTSEGIKTMSLLKMVNRSVKFSSQDHSLTAIAFKKALEALDNDRTAQVQTEKELTAFMKELRQFLEAFRNGSLAPRQPPPRQQPE